MNVLTMRWLEKLREDNFFRGDGRHYFHHNELTEKSWSSMTMAPTVLRKTGMNSATAAR